MKNGAWGLGPRAFIASTRPQALGPSKGDR